MEVNPADSKHRPPDQEEGHCSAGGADSSISDVHQNETPKSLAQSPEKDIVDNAHGYNRRDGTNDEVSDMSSTFHSDLQDGYVEKKAAIPRDDAEEVGYNEDLLSVTEASITKSDSNDHVSENLNSDYPSDFPSQSAFDPRRDVFDSSSEKSDSKELLKDYQPATAGIIIPPLAESSTSAKPAKGKGVNQFNLDPDEFSTQHRLRSKEQFEQGDCKRSKRISASNIDCLNKADGIISASGRSRSLCLMPSIEEGIEEEKGNAYVSQSSPSSSCSSLASSPNVRFRQECVPRVSSKPTLMSISEELVCKTEASLKTSTATTDGCAATDGTFMEEQNAGLQSTVDQDNGDSVSPTPAEHRGDTFRTLSTLTDGKPQQEFSYFPCGEGYVEDDKEDWVIIDSSFCPPKDANAIVVGTCFGHDARAENFLEPTEETRTNEHKMETNKTATSEAVPGAGATMQAGDSPNVHRSNTGKESYEENDVKGDSIFLSQSCKPESISRLGSHYSESEVPGEHESGDALHGALGSRRMGKTATLSNEASGPHSEADAYMPDEKKRNIRKKGDKHSSNDKTGYAQTSNHSTDQDTKGIGGSKLKGSGSDSIVADNVAISGDNAAARESHSEHKSSSGNTEKSDKDYKEKESQKQDSSKRKRDQRDRGIEENERKECLKNAVGDVRRFMMERIGQTTLCELRYPDVKATCRLQSQLMDTTGENFLPEHSPQQFNLEELSGMEDMDQESAHEVEGSIESSKHQNRHGKRKSLWRQKPEDSVVSDHKLENPIATPNEEEPSSCENNLKSSESVTNEDMSNLSEVVIGSAHTDPFDWQLTRSDCQTDSQPVNLKRSTNRIIPPSHMKDTSFNHPSSLQSGGQEHVPLPGESPSFDEESSGHLAEAQSNLQNSLEIPVTSNDVNAEEDFSEVSAIDLSSAEDMVVASNTLQHIKPMSSSDPLFQAAEMPLPDSDTDLIIKDEEMKLETVVCAFQENLEADEHSSQSNKDQIYQSKVGLNRKNDNPLPNLHNFVSVTEPRNDVSETCKFPLISEEQIGDPDYEHTCYGHQNEFLAKETSIHDAWNDLPKNHKEMMSVAENDDLTSQNGEENNHEGEPVCFSTATEGESDNCCNQNLLPNATQHTGHKDDLSSETPEKKPSSHYPNEEHDHPDSQSGSSEIKVDDCEMLLTDSGDTDPSLSREGNSVIFNPTGEYISKRNEQEIFAIEIDDSESDGMLQTEDKVILIESDENECEKIHQKFAVSEENSESPRETTEYETCDGHDRYVTGGDIFRSNTISGKAHEIDQDCEEYSHESETFQESWHPTDPLGMYDYEDEPKVMYEIGHGKKDECQKLCEKTVSFHILDMVEGEMGEDVEMKNEGPQTFIPNNSEMLWQCKEESDYKNIVSAKKRGTDEQSENRTEYVYGAHNEEIALETEKRPEDFQRLHTGTNVIVQPSQVEDESVQVLVVDGKEVCRQRVDRINIAGEEIFDQSRDNSESIYELHLTREDMSLHVTESHKHLHESDFVDKEIGLKPEDNLQNTNGENLHSKEKIVQQSRDEAETNLQGEEIQPTFYDNLDIKGRAFFIEGEQQQIKNINIYNEKVFQYKDCEQETAYQIDFQDEDRLLNHDTELENIKGDHLPYEAIAEQRGIETGNTYDTGSYDKISQIYKGIPEIHVHEQDLHDDEDPESEHDKNIVKDKMSPKLQDDPESVDEQDVNEDQLSPKLQVKQDSNKDELSRKLQEDPESVHEQDVNEDGLSQKLQEDPESVHEQDANEDELSQKLQKDPESVHEQDVNEDELSQKLQEDPESVYEQDDKEGQLSPKPQDEQASVHAQDFNEDELLHKLQEDQEGINGPHMNGVLLSHQRQKYMEDVPEQDLHDDVLSKTPPNDLVSMNEQDVDEDEWSQRPQNDPESVHEQDIFEDELSEKLQGDPESTYEQYFDEEEISQNVLDYPKSVHEQVICEDVLSPKYQDHPEGIHVQDINEDEWSQKTQVHPESIHKQDVDEDETLPNPQDDSDSAQGRDINEHEMSQKCQDDQESFHEQDIYDDAFSQELKDDQQSIHAVGVDNGKIIKKYQVEAENIPNVNMDENGLYNETEDKVVSRPKETFDEIETSQDVDDDEQDMHSVNCEDLEMPQAFESKPESMDKFFLEKGEISERLEDKAGSMQRVSFDDEEMPVKLEDKPESMQRVNVDNKEVPVNSNNDEMTEQLKEKLDNMNKIDLDHEMSEKLEETDDISVKLIHETEIILDDVNLDNEEMSEKIENLENITVVEQERRGCTYKIYPEGKDMLQHSEYQPESESEQYLEKEEISPPGDKLENKHGDDLPQERMHPRYEDETERKRGQYPTEKAISLQFQNEQENLQGVYVSESVASQESKQNVENTLSQDTNVEQMGYQPEEKHESVIEDTLGKEIISNISQDDSQSMQRIRLYGEEAENVQPMFTSELNIALRIEGTLENESRSGKDFNVGLESMDVHKDEVVCEGDASTYSDSSERSAEKYHEEETILIDSHKLPRSERKEVDDKELVKKQKETESIGHQGVAKSQLLLGKTHSDELSAEHASPHNSPRGRSKTESDGHIFESHILPSCEDKDQKDPKDETLCPEVLVLHAEGITSYPMVDPIIPLEQENKSAYKVDGMRQKVKKEKETDQINATEKEQDNATLSKSGCGEYFQSDESHPIDLNEIKLINSNSDMKDRAYTDKQEDEFCDIKAESNDTKVQSSECGNHKPLTSPRSDGKDDSTSLRGVAHVGDIREASVLIDVDSKKEHSILDMTDERDNEDHDAAVGDARGSQNDDDWSYAPCKPLETRIGDGNVVGLESEIKDGQKLSSTISDVINLNDALASKANVEGEWKTLPFRPSDKQNDETAAEQGTLMAVDDKTNKSCSDIDEVERLAHQPSGYEDNEETDVSSGVLMQEPLDDDFTEVAKKSQGTRLEKTKTTISADSITPGTKLVLKKKTLWGKVKAKLKPSLMPGRSSQDDCGQTCEKSDGHLATTAVRSTDKGGQEGSSVAVKANDGTALTAWHHPQRAKRHRVRHKSKAYMKHARKLRRLQVLRLGAENMVTEKQPPVRRHILNRKTWQVQGGASGRKSKSSGKQKSTVAKKGSADEVTVGQEVQRPVRSNSATNDSGTTGMFEVSYETEWNGASQMSQSLVSKETSPVELLMKPLMSGVMAEQPPEAESSPLPKAEKMREFIPDASTMKTRPSKRAMCAIM